MREQWLAAKGLGTCARQFLLELDKLHSMDVVLPICDGGAVHVRTVARPEKPLAELLAHLGLDLPETPKIIGHAVPKTVPSEM